MSLSDLAGALGGWAAAPVFGAVAAVKHRRAVHSRGVVYAGRVVPVGEDGVSRRFHGPALVRFSATLWPHDDARPDLLGLAVRIGDRQDLLFATVKRPWTFPAAFLTTRRHDFLDNQYFGVAPFLVDGLGRVRLRVVPRDVPPCEGSDRDERLADAVSKGPVAFELQAAKRMGAWRTLAEVHVTSPADVDPEAVRFSPFRDGLGVRPVGFVHGMRHGTYEASRAGSTL